MKRSSARSVDNFFDIGIAKSANSAPSASMSVNHRGIEKKEERRLYRSEQNKNESVFICSYFFALCPLYSVVNFYFFHDHKLYGIISMESAITLL